jgi:hypothetical protein
MANSDTVSVSMMLRLMREVWLMMQCLRRRRERKGGVRADEGVCGYGIEIAQLGMEVDPPLASVASRDDVVDV